jgi:hypothetical protein
MYNEALVSALNADRQRRYDDLERLRRQREILQQRDAADGTVEAAPRRRGDGRRATSFRRLAAR